MPGQKTQRQTNEQMLSTVKQISGYKPVEYTIPSSETEGKTIEEIRKLVFEHNAKLKEGK